MGMHVMQDYKMALEITHPTQGIVGWLHEVESVDNQSVLVFQLPRTTAQINAAFSNNAKEKLAKVLPTGRSALLIGADVNVYELFGADAVVLKLKGII